MRKSYISPLVEDVKMDTLMQTFLDIQSVSAPQTGELQ